MEIQVENPWFVVFFLQIVTKQDIKLQSEATPRKFSSKNPVVFSFSVQRKVLLCSYDEFDALKI
jgi:hypothetical protein